METKIRVNVRGYHEDRFGHVNHARYLELLEEARWAHLDDRGLDQAFFKSQGIFPVVAGLTIAYRRPASAGDTLEIVSKVSHVGSRKIEIEQQARFAETGKTCVEATVAVVLVDAHTGRAAPITDTLLTAWPDLAAAHGLPSSPATDETSW